MPGAQANAAVHVDYRLDNLMFSDDSGEVELPGREDGSEHARFRRRGRPLRGQAR